MEIIGYAATLLIGISLGLTGSGGSILMMPILVYLFKLDFLQATGYSLFVVGLTSLVGVVKYSNQKHINLVTSLIFGIPSLLLVSITRKYIVPQIPSTIYLTESMSINRDFILMIFFATLMIAASLRFIRKPQTETLKNSPNSPVSWIKLAIVGMVVGFLTGLLGIGGGFLIIPALVSFAYMDMKKAVGTSLLLITVNSIAGFLSQNNLMNIDWRFLMIVSSISILGMLIGSGFVKRINSQQLKVGFGWFILSVGIFILVKEIVYS